MPAFLSLLFAWTFPLDASGLVVRDLHQVERSLGELGPCRALALVFVSERAAPSADDWRRWLEWERRPDAAAVQFAVVLAGPDDSVRVAAAEVLARDSRALVLRDEQATAAKQLGVTSLPQAVLLDGSFRLRYRGRIAGDGRGQPDLGHALDDLLAGRDIQVAATPDVPISSPIAWPPRTPQAVTFARDVAPLLQKHCQSCHRPDGGAPFTLLSYADAVQHAEMIAEVVTQERMPPWHAVAPRDLFVNDRRLTVAERDTFRDWAAIGTPRGDAADLPPPQTFPTGPWRAGTPDMVLGPTSLQKIPATGMVDYRIIPLPYLPLADVWVDRIDIRTDNPRVVHHANLFAYPANLAGKELFLTGIVPGGAPMQLDPGTAALLPKGMVVGLQVHFTTTGKEEQARLWVGLGFPREKVQKRLHYALISPEDFAIPPGAGHHEMRISEPIGFDATMVAMFPHMHLRGKDMSFFAVEPNGNRRPLLVVPDYDFSWQQTYLVRPGAQRLKAGTVLESVAHFDNSAFNAANPDPTATVRYGRQADSEMMYAFWFFTRDDEQLNLIINPKTGRAVQTRKEDKD